MLFVINNSSFDFFGFFLVLSLLILFLGFTYSAIKSKILTLNQASSTFFIVVFFAIVGSKVFSIPLDSWIYFMNGGGFPFSKQLSVTGGLLFMLIGVFVAKKTFKITVPVLDHFALILPIAMAVQRLGCLFAGCCNGIPTESDWGVQYAKNTVAHICAANHEYINSIDDLTPSLHPVPIYLMIAALLSFVILLFFKKRIYATGNLFLISISLFLAGKFITEFFREPLTHGTSGVFFAGLMLNQWTLISIVLLISIIIIVKEKRYSTASVSIANEPIPHSRMLIRLVLISLVYFACNNWFSDLENACLLLFLAFALLNTVFELIFKHSKSFALITVRHASLSLFLIAFFPITAQIAFNNVKSSSPHTYSELKIGGSLASDISHYHSPAVDSANSCGHNYQYPRKYSHDVKWLGVSYSKYFNYGNHDRLYFHLSGALGHDRSNDKNHADSSPGGDYLYDFTVSGGFDTKLVGMQGGLHFGYLRGLDIKTGDQKYSLSNGRPSELILPLAKIRIGYIPTIYFDGRAGFPLIGINGSIYPVVVGIGSGFGRNNGVQLHVGADLINQSFDMGGDFIIPGEKFGFGFGMNIGEHQMGYFSISRYFNKRALDSGSAPWRD